MNIARILVAGSLALVAFATSANAKSFTIGDPPVAVVSLPDRWQPTEYEGGVEANAPNRGAYVAIEAVKIDDIATATRDGIKFFQKQGVKIDQSTMNKRDTTIGDLPAVDVTWQGRDTDGPTNVGLTFVVLNDKQSVLLYIWGSDDHMRISAKELKAIAESLKPVGR